MATRLERRKKKTCCWDRGARFLVLLDDLLHGLHWSIRLHEKLTCKIRRNAALHAKNVALLIATFGFDTIEHGPSKVEWGKG